jgi:single-strand DNA-binding protein
MAAQVIEESDVVERPEVFVNEIRIVGRLNGVPDERELPSGDVVVNLQLAVERIGESAQRQKKDVIDCALWTRSLRTKAVKWQPDDIIDVRGALRRRFFQTAGGLMSRVEIEVESAVRLNRARPAKSG